MLLLTSTLYLAVDTLGGHKRILLVMEQETLHVKLDEEVVAAIDRLADAETRSRNNMLKVLIVEALERREDPRRRRKSKG